MKDEYIIINKTQLLKRIEELETDSIHLEWAHNIKTHNGHSPQQRERKKMIDLELNVLNEVLSQSTPLIPEIKKAFDAGRKLSNKSQLYVPDFYWSKEDYISNLKLDI